MLGSADKDSAAPGSVQERDAYDVPEVAVRLGVHESYVWKLIARGELDSFPLGRRRKVAAQDLKAFIDRLREEARRAREAAVAS